MYLTEQQLIENQKRHLMKAEKYHLEATNYHEAADHEKATQSTSMALKYFDLAMNLTK